MLTEFILKKTENFILDSSIKSHYKKQEYSRDTNSMRDFVDFFKKTSLKLFLPSKPLKLFDTSEFQYLSPNHYILKLATPYKPTPIFLDDYLQEKQLHYMKIHYFPLNYHKRKVKVYKKTNRAIIYFHGWGRNSFKIESLFQFKIFQKAYNADIFAIELPYHHSRNPRGFSGQGFLDGDPIRTIEAFRQATIEAYYLFTTLKEGYESVAAIGVSLGAHILIMLNLLLNVPFFSISALVGTPLKSNFKNLKISPNLLKAMQSKDVMDALTLLDFNKIPVNQQNSNQYLFGGKFDPLISPQTVLNLGKHIKCKTFLLPSGHFTFPLFFPYIVKKIAHWPDKE